MKKIFNNWDFKKHAKFVTIFYGILYAIDLTLGYLVIKKITKKTRKTKEA